MWVHLSASLVVHIWRLFPMWITRTRGQPPKIHNRRIPAGDYYSSCIAWPSVINSGSGTPAQTPDYVRLLTIMRIRPFPPGMPRIIRSTENDDQQLSGGGGGSSSDLSGG